MNTLNLQGCWLVNVPHAKYGYSIPVYVNYHAEEEDVIDMCLQNGLFEDAADADYANAVQMSQYDYDHLKDYIIILTA